MVALLRPSRASWPAPDVEAARSEVERRSAELVPTLLAHRPEEIRRLGRRAIDADRAALRRRAMVGEAPPLDLDAVAAAVDAFDALRRAREGERDTLDEGLRWLALGNVWGIAGLVLAVVLVASVHEPTSPLVYTAVVAAAAGPISTGFLGLCRRSLAAMRTRAARAEWVAALDASGFDTFGTLHARRLAHAAWVRRAEEAAVAGAAARDARAAWHRVAGPRSHPREAPALAARVGRLRCAQLELFGALLAERLAAPTLRAAAVPGREEGRLDPVVETPFGRSGFRMR